MVLTRYWDTNFSYLLPTGKLSLWTLVKKNGAMYYLIMNPLLHSFSIFIQAVARELDNALAESRATITIDLRDVNDNWPEFPEDSYTADIPENSPRNTLVTTITVGFHTG